MNITRDILIKYNNMFLGIIKYYKIDDTCIKKILIPSNGGKVRYVGNFRDLYVLDIFAIGYPIEYNKERELYKEMYYLIDMKYELLIPFYEFAAIFNNDFPPYINTVPQNCFQEMNACYKKITALVKN